MVQFDLISLASVVAGLVLAAAGVLLGLVKSSLSSCMFLTRKNPITVTDAINEVLNTVLSRLEAEKI